MKKILIIKLSALGDVCLSLPHINVLLEHHVDDEIWVLTGPAYTDFFINHPKLNVIDLDRSSFFGLKSRLARIVWVRRQGFDVIYDLQGNKTSRLLVQFSGAKKRIGTQPWSVFDTHPAGLYTIRTQQSIFDRLNDTLAAAGLPRAGAHCTLYPFPGDREKVARWKDDNLSGRRYVLMHAGCSPEWPSKQWPREYFAELAGMIEEKGCRIVWVGGREESEINRNLAQTTGLDATGEFSLLQLYLLAQDAAFAVTNDSGPMHVMAIAGIPVYSFFGPTSWVRSQAAGQKERVLHREMECSPCFLKNCPPEKKHACLKLLTPMDVFARITDDNLES